jgi:hypothetical protein
VSGIVLAVLWTRRLNFSDGKEIIDRQSEQGGGPEKAIDMSKAARVLTSEAGK